MTSVHDVVLVLNSGSSSLKYAAFDLAAPERGPIFAGQVDPNEGEAAFDVIDRSLTASGSPAPTAIGHRIVHGGPHLLRHCLIDPRVLEELELAKPFAPLHASAALALLRHAMARYPKSSQVACFDTAFHAGMPDIARTLPVPRDLRDSGVHRYGFHGLSCESIVRQLGDDLPERLIIAHLGSGASVTAVRSGRSIDTSMGLTPSGGVIMSTRCGDIDPGVLIHVMRARGCDPSELEIIIDQRSGMLGVSDLSGDMRRLRLAPPGSEADLAVRMFCRSVSKQITGMMTALGGAHLLVFTGGIGEHDEAVRHAVCADLAWTGLSILPGNPATASRCRAITLPSCEEEQIARHAKAIVSAIH